MRDQQIQTHQLPNGLTLVAESMPEMQSAAFSLLVPAGSINDQPGQNGTASILSDLITRGAGSRTSRQLSFDLDNLGLQRHEGVGCSHISFSGAAVAQNLPEALRIYGDIVRRPHLPAEELQGTIKGVEQTLLGIEDEPRQKVIIELKRRCYDAPWGLPSDGALDDLKNITIESTTDHFKRCFRPNGTILGVAGRVDFQEIKSLAEEVFGDWESKADPVIETIPHGESRDHISHESTQTHIGLAYQAVPYRHDDYYAAWAAVGVLSGGMSARLFTEVREKRGLCYSVYASLNGLPHEGRVLCYAGTTAERAQETLEVTLGELVRLGEGIEKQELERCQARAKSSLIMQQESTIARSSSVARDWFFLGRVQTLEEVRQKIDSLTVDQVLEYVHRYPAQDFTILTIGPNSLEVPDAFS